MKGFLKPSPEWDRVTLFIPDSAGEPWAGQRGRAERIVLMMRADPKGPRHACPVPFLKLVVLKEWSQVP